MEYLNAPPVSPAPQQPPAAAPPLQPIPAESPPPQTASPAPAEVAINQANAITVAEALHIAQQMGVPIGKSTLQRRAKTQSLENWGRDA